MGVLRLTLPCIRDDAEYENIGKVFFATHIFQYVWEVRRRTSNT